MLAVAANLALLSCTFGHFWPQTPNWQWPNANIQHLLTASEFSEVKSQQLRTTIYICLFLLSDINWPIYGTTFWICCAVSGGVWRSLSLVRYQITSTNFLWILPRTHLPHLIICLLPAHSNVTTFSGVQVGGCRGYRWNSRGAGGAASFGCCSAEPIFLEMYGSWLHLKNKAEHLSLI